MFYKGNCKRIRWRRWIKHNLLLRMSFKQKQGVQPTKKKTDGQDNKFDNKKWNQNKKDPTEKTQKL